MLEEPEEKIDQEKFSDYTPCRSTLDRNFPSTIACKKIIHHASVK